MASLHDQDWQQNKSVLQCNKYMFENQIHCDITFTFKNKDSRGTIRHRETGTSQRPNFVSAHKYVLISRSPAFYAKFTGSDRDGPSSMNVEDVDKPVFIKMLRSVCDFCWELIPDIRSGY